MMHRLVGKFLILWVCLVLPMESFAVAAWTDSKSEQSARSLSDLGVRSEASGKLRIVFRPFEANGGFHLTKMAGKIDQFNAAAVGQSQVRQAPRHPCPDHATQDAVVQVMKCCQSSHCAHCLDAAASAQGCSTGCVSCPIVFAAIESPHASPFTCASFTVKPTVTNTHSPFATRLLRPPIS
jgi:hypothetical protein